MARADGGGGTAKRRIGIKVMATILVVTMVAAGASLVLLIGTGSNDQTWEGVLISPETLGDHTVTTPVLVGSQVGSGSARAVAVTGCDDFSGIEGGRFTLRVDETGYHVVGEEVPVDTLMEMAQMPSVGAHANVILDAPSISTVYPDYSYGVVSDGTHDYTWIAPGVSLRSLFNPVELTGTVMTDSELGAIKTAFPASRFASMDVNDYLDLVNEFSLQHMADPFKFIVVDGASCLGAVPVRGDAVALLGHDWRTTYGSVFYFDAINWIINLGHYMAGSVLVVTDENNTLNQRTVWMALCPLDQEWPTGLCGMRFAVSDTDVLGKRIQTLNSTSFVPQVPDYGNWTLHVGVAVSISEAPAPGEQNVTGVWEDLVPHSKGMVGTVSAHGYCVPSDEYTIGWDAADVLGRGFDLSNILYTFSMAYNERGLLMVDEDLSSCLAGNGTMALEHAVMILVPWPMDTESGLMDLTVEGVLYDLGVLYGSPDSLPLIIADSVTQREIGLRNTTVEEIVSGIPLEERHGVAMSGVSFDATLTGNALLYSPWDPAYPGAALSRNVTTDFPVLMSLYEAVGMAGNATFHVPVVCLNSSGAAGASDPEVMHVEGVYIDLAADLGSMEDFVRDGMSTVSPPEDDVIPPGVLEQILEKEDGILDGQCPHGYVLAYMAEAGHDVPIGVEMTSPSQDESVQPSRFDIAFNISGTVRFPLWIAVCVWGLNETGYQVILPSTVLPALQAGEWNASDLWFWGGIVDEIASTHWSGSCTMSVQIVDLQGGASSVTMSVDLVLLDE